MKLLKKRLYEINFLKNRRNFILFIFALLIFLFIVIINIFSTPIYKRLTEIDINSGKLRIQTYFLLFNLNRRIVETEFSRLVFKYGLAGDKEKWMKVSSRSYYLGFSGLKVSCSIYKYRICPVICKNLIKIFYIKEISDSQRKELVQNFLSDMRNGNLSKLEKQSAKLQKTY